MIPISNVYYLLAYACNLMSQQGFRRLSKEPFENAEDLLAALLLQSLRPYLVKGLASEFVRDKKETSSLHGKFYFDESIKQGLLAKHQLICSEEHLELEELLSQVIKTALEFLSTQNLTPTRQRQVQRYKHLFKEIPKLEEWTSISWSQLYKGRRKKEIALCNVCRLILEGNIQAKRHGKLFLEEILDEKSLPKLYEKFLLGYFRIEHPHLHPSSPQIRWAIQEGADPFLPRMQTDVVLQTQNHILIVDAKYYSNLLQYNPFGQKETLHSAHLYQLFAYLKNWPVKEHQKVDGLLLYAKSDQGIDLDQCYDLQGHTLQVKTLDLSQPFEDISKALDEIALFLEKV
ncbi:MAG: hypothetical protein HDR44_03410 [Allobaculum sp.]|nr:hypothetical protein [Allobaculum sp.]